MKAYLFPTRMLKKRLVMATRSSDSVGHVHLTHSVVRTLTLRQTFQSPARQLLCAAFAVLTLGIGMAQAQVQGQSQVVPRITQTIDESSLVTLKGTVHPLTKSATDLGPASPDTRVDRIQLMFKRSPQQQSDLEDLIAKMHTQGTSTYHKWLTPAQFGQQFGPADQDIQAIEAWVQSHGFSIGTLQPGKGVLEISGSIGQVQDTFHTSIHQYMLAGRVHYANATDPQIPSALAPVLAGFVSLNNFPVRRLSRTLGKATYDPQTGHATPEWTEPNTNAPLGYYLVVSPADFNVQYDVSPLITAGTNGTGQSIAIINDSNINVSMVNNFRTLFGLPANPPQVVIDGNDPGIDGTNNPDGPNGDSVEAYLDTEWSGAVAPNATINLVIGADTAFQSGLILAAQRAVYSNLAPVMSVSFGSCEQSLGANNTFLNSLWQQAAAQGITVLVSTGDSGSAGLNPTGTTGICDAPGDAAATGGLAVSGYASTPYNVAVGGTDFFYSSYNQGQPAVLAQLGQYWNLTPSPTPKASLTTPILEQPWNDTEFGLNILVPASSPGIVGGGGGASSCATGSASPTTGEYTSCTAGYAKPSWQTGTGVPNDKVRDLPDVSLFAADGINNSFYPICAVDGDCQPGASTTQITGVGGTSASAPSFAGIMALVNQKYGPQGQADFVLYPLAKQHPTAFHDVTNGTNAQPCVLASPNCVAGGTTAGQGELSGWPATVGYDLASGLGSIDANQLVTSWNTVTFTSTTTTLTASSTSFAHGTPVTINTSVTGSGGTPTGSVALMTDSTTVNQQALTTLQLASGSASGSMNFLPGGKYNIWGQYSGDGAFGASTSSKTEITVSPEPSGIYFSLISPKGTLSSGTTNVDYGTQLLLSAQVAPSSQLTALQNCRTGVSATCPTFTPPTGTIVFADNSATINTAVINVEGDAEYNAPFAVGAHSVTASYAGDDSYNKSAASAITFTVVKDTPQITMSASNQVSATQWLGGQGQGSVFNVQVLNNAQATAGSSSTGAVYPVPVAPPTGTITVTGFPSGVPTTGTLAPAVDPSVLATQGIATITAPATTPAGTYNVKISYPGDANYNATSITTTVQILQNSGTATTTTATVVGSTISPTTNITISGTVTAQSGSAAPSGSVLIYSSGYLINSGIPLNTPTSGTASTFSATLNSQTLFQGANFVTLQYAPAQNSPFATSSFTLNNGSAISNPLSDFSMVPETTLVPVTSSSPGTDTINLTSVNGFSGAVSFTCTGQTVTCSVTSSATLTSGSTAPLTLTINAGSSAANQAYNVLVTGTDSTGKFVHTLAITALVTGSTGPAAGFALSSNPATLTFNTGATTGNTSTITATPSGGFTGTVAFTCAVTGPSGATSPATCSLAPASATIAGAAAVTSTLTIATTATTTGGAYTVTVTGTSGSTVETTTVAATVNVPTFSLSSTAAAAVNPGASATSTITVNPMNGFTAAVALTCSVTTSPSGAANMPTCSLSPASTTTTSTLTITTTGTMGAVHRPLDKFFAVGGGVALAGLLFFGIPARRRSWRAILGILVFAAIASIGAIGCGGGSSGSGSGSGSSSTGTTAGGYVITVSGISGSLAAQTTTVNLTVN